MSQPVEATYITAQGLAAISFHPDGRVWKPGTQTFVVYVDANIATYGYLLNEYGGSGYYRCPYPSGIPNNILTTEVIYWMSNNSTIRGVAAGDIIVGTGQTQGVNIKLVNGVAFPGGTQIAGQLEALWTLKATMQTVYPVPVTGKPSELLTQFCQQNDIGIPLVIQFLDQNNIPINLSTATNLYIKIGYPDGTSKNFAAALYTDGTDGKIVYVSAGSSPTDLSQVGDHIIQGRVTISGIKSSRTGKLLVYANVNDDTLPPAP